MSFRLTMAAEASARRELLFEQTCVTIGRASGCDLVLDEPSTSRRHARISRQGAAYFIEDLASSNGTKVNGIAVQKMQLSEGDAIALGPVVLSFSVQNRIPSDAVAAAVPDSGTRILSLPSLPGRAASPWVRWFRRAPRAADRARIVRAILGVACSAVALGVLVMVMHQTFGDRERSTLPPEPERLSQTPIEDSFGLGEGVTYVRPDMKVFDFELHSPGRAVAVLHYYSRDISPGEVVVSANGAEVGTVPADPVNTSDVSHEIIIRPDLLKRGEQNKIIFDNTRNPPGSETWRIWNVWLEVIMLPEMARDQLLREANLSFRRAQQNLEHRDVGAANRYLAWKDYRSSWLTLEAHPDPKPDLYLLSRDQLQEAQQELDRICSKLMLEVHRAQQVKDWRAARAALDQVKLYFPGNDQSCPWRAEQKRAELHL